MGEHGRARIHGIRGARKEVRAKALPKTADKLADASDPLAVAVAVAVGIAHDANGAAIVPEPPDHVSIVKNSRSRGGRALQH